MPDLDALIAVEHWGVNAFGKKYHVVIVDCEDPPCHNGGSVQVMIWPGDQTPPPATECCAHCLRWLEREAALPGAAP